MALLIWLSELRMLSELTLEHVQTVTEMITTELTEIPARPSRNR